MSERILALIVIVLIPCAIWFITYKAGFYSGDTSDLGPCSSVKEFDWREKKRDDAKREQEYKDLMHELNQLRKQIEKLNKE